MAHIYDSAIKNDNSARIIMSIYKVYPKFERYLKTNN